MAYRFAPDDRSVQTAFRRIAREQIEKAVVEIDDPDLPRDATVHQVRKRCKKLRGLIRLVRPAFGDYRVENAHFRDAARALSPFRDNDVLISTFDTLMGEAKGGGDFDAVRERLAARHGRLHLRQAEAAQDASSQLALFRTDMTGALGRVATWTLSAKGFVALAGGLQDTYRRGRVTGRKARSDPSAENMHEWRKRVKYHGYHATLLAPLWPEIMSAHCAETDRLGELLGDHNDLSVFASVLRQEPGIGGDPVTLKTLLRLAGTRQDVLQADAFRIGLRLFAEQPDALATRWRASWKAWRSETRAGRQRAQVVKAA